MLRISLESLEAGMKIAKQVYDADGNLLLGKGVTLNEFFVKRLQMLGIESIFIKDDAADDVIPHESISEIVRGATIKHMKELFRPLEDIKKEMKNQTAAALLDSVKSPRFQQTFGNNPAFQKIQNSAKDIVNEVLSGDVTLGLNSIKSYDNYTFQHSIDVAIVSILIGRKLALPEKRLRELGIGCILHDMGKIFIPDSIVNKPGRLTDEEFERVKDHPVIGYELIKDVTTIGILPPHVAFQHHEKQDGSGYPRGLKGNNKLDISGEKGMIHLYASIAGVADVYDALSSDRPYRTALQPEKVIEIMMKMKGDHLNKSIFSIFLKIAPMYPVGTTIRMGSGKYPFHYGVVIAINEQNLERPVVRLVLNSQKKKIPPVDINLLEQEEVQIESVIL